MNPTLRTLALTPLVKRALLRSALFSALSIVGTALAFISLAQVLASAVHGQAVAAGHWMGILFGLLLRAVAQTAREWLGARLAAQEIARQRAALTTQALALGPVALSVLNTSDLAVLDAELEGRLTPFYARFLPSSVHAALSVLILLLLTWRLDPATAVLLAVTGPLTLVFLYLVGLATQAATDAQWQAHTRLAGRVVTLVRHLPTLHAFGQVTPYRDVLERSAAQHRETTLKVLRVAFLSGFVMEFAGTLSTALIAVWIGVRLFGGSVELAPTLAALMLVAEFFGPLRQLGADRHAAMDAEPVAAELAKVAAHPLAPSGTARTPSGQLNVQVQDVRATYTPHLPALSLSLPSGTHLALRGPSGSGKTTLLHLLRKHAPYQGEVTVNGVPLDELDRAAWQAQVTFVPQHPRLVSGNVWDNLKLVNAQASEQEMLSALQAVHLLATLERLPDGLSTRLGEGGVQLSGGEVARLALARALISRAPLVLLDEVTAHLDAQTEADILKVIEQVFKGQTVILATHRLAPASYQTLHLTGRSAA